jgi:hypothetical protein
VQHGAAALAGLLGVRAGRFAVTDSSESCRRDFEGTLEDVLAPALVRARAVQQALAGENLVRVARVELDESALSPYLDTMPENPAAAVLTNRRDPLRRTFDAVEHMPVATHRGYLERQAVIVAAYLTRCHGTSLLSSAFVHGTHGLPIRTGLTPTHPEPVTRVAARHCGRIVSANTARLRR